MTILEILTGLFTLVGGIVCTAAAIGVAYYLATRRPTPDATVQEAVTSIRWSYAIGLFVLPCAITGAQEYGSLSGALVGGAFGGSFVLLIVVCQWWWGPL